ncbi:MAG: SagB/ThcOx family dehydrogenase [Armatimonadota bacterium]|nr:MAG: SagB/ThcOx family dehydrogenase [Armatimonadota bacterium]
MGEDTTELARVKVGSRVSLPPATKKGEMSVEEAVARRRSVRDFTADALSLAEISQLLWSAHGLTSAEGLRAAPSAGACYPLEVYLACEQGLFRYQPSEHALVKVSDADPRQPLAEAAYGQFFISDAAVSIIFAAVYERTTARYGDRGIRYVHMDIGHAAQNVHLQAEALGLASVPVGAFDDSAVASVLSLPAEEKTVYIVPVGRPARG